MGCGGVTYLALFPGKDNQGAAEKRRASGVGDVHGSRQGEASVGREITFPTVASVSFSISAKTKGFQSIIVSHVGVAKKPRNASNGVGGDFPSQTK